MTDLALVVPADSTLQGPRLHYGLFADRDAGIHSSAVPPSASGCDRQEATPTTQARCRTAAGSSYSGVPGGGGRAQAAAKQRLSPRLHSTERNHSVEAPVPATTSAMVATVESIRKAPAGSVNVRTTRPTLSNRNIPAHSQVAPWMKRCGPG